MCRPLLLKIIVCTATVDSRETISIICAQLNNIDAYAAGVNDDVEQITAFFTENLDWLKALGENLDDEVNTFSKV